MNGRSPWKAHSPCYASDPLGTSETMERRVLAEIGSEKLLRAIQKYVESHQPQARL